MKKKFIDIILFILLFLSAIFGMNESKVFAAKNDTFSESSISSEKISKNMDSNNSVNLKAFLNTPLPLSAEEFKDPPIINSSNTVHVSTANEFLDAVYNSDDKTATFENRGFRKDSSIHKIILDKNINLYDTTYNNTGGNYHYLYINHGTLVIDGDGHNLDMGNIDIALVSGMENQNYTLENMTIEGTSYYGPISVNSPNTTLNYSNISYYGSQLVWSAAVINSKVNIYGDVNIHSLYQYTSYPSTNPKGKTVLTDASGTQQNMQTGDLELHAGPNTMVKHTTAIS